MKEVLEAIRTRRSCRSFAPEPLAEDTIAAILSAGTWAPSAGNVQPWFFYLVRDRYLKEKLSNAALGQSFIAQAPLVVVVCADAARAKRAYK
ncbi:MAG: nitroreductase family protein, partial [Deltaproteobacteria bacterium]